MIFNQLDEIELGEVDESELFSIPPLPTPR